MVLLDTPAPSAVQPAALAPWRRRDRRVERRRLAEADRLSVRRAELHLVRALLAAAGERVGSGWVQHCWFTVRDEQGGRRPIGPMNLQDIGGRPVAEVCLVGAIVEAGGGVARAGTHRVHRALDLTWATLYNQPVRWYPSPTARLAHVHELTRWNDAPARTADDVADLLMTASLRAHC